jgi:hypothetical protein
MRDITTTPPISSDLLDIFLEMTGEYMSFPNRVDSTGNSLQLYLDAVNFRNRWNRTVSYPAYAAVRRQYLARLAQIPHNAQLTPDLAALLASVYGIIWAPTDDERSESITDVLSLYTNSPFKDRLWSFNDAQIKFAITLPLFCDPSLITSSVTVPPYKFSDETWREWFVQISLGCEKLLESKYYTSEAHFSLLGLYCKLINSIPRLEMRTDDRLNHIINPDVGFMVWTQGAFQPRVISRAVETQPSAGRRGPVWKTLLELVDLSRLNFDLFSLTSTPVLVALIHETLVCGSLRAQVDYFDCPHGVKGM